MDFTAKSRFPGPQIVSLVPNRGRGVVGGGSLRIIIMGDEGGAYRGRAMGLAGCSNSGGWKFRTQRGSLN